MKSGFKDVSYSTALYLGQVVVNYLSLFSFTLHKAVLS